MVFRGQGAMEYLMTYGWAILVVMVAGVAMWQLGIFNMSGDTAPTSTGFSVFKPLLATCQLRNDIIFIQAMSAAITYNGSTCQFINNAGTTIYVTDVEVKVNNEDCYRHWINSTTGGNMLEQNCQNHDRYNSSTYPMPIPSGSQFTILTGNPMWGGAMGGVTCPGGCSTITPRLPYTVSYDISYNIPIGGVTTSKHETGTVRVIAD
jgi:hypothetical protein